MNNIDWQSFQNNLELGGAGDDFLQKLGLGGLIRSHGASGVDAQGNSTDQAAYIDPSLDGYQLGSYQLDGTHQGYVVKDASGNVVKQFAMPRAHQSLTGSDYAQAIGTAMAPIAAGYGLQALGAFGGAAGQAGSGWAGLSEASFPETVGSGLGEASGAGLGAADLGGASADVMAGGEGTGGLLGGSADKAALYGDAGYGAGMSGKATGVYDALSGAGLGGTIANAGAGLAGAVPSWVTPKLAGTVAGALLGGFGGKAGNSGGGNGYTYNGQIPTVNRTDWQSQIKPQYMAKPNLGGLLTMPQNIQKNDGLGRFLGLLGG